MRSTTVVLLFVLELLQVGGFVVPRGMALSMSGGGTVRKLALSEQRPSEFYPQFFENLPSMAGKTVVVTGASRGLGYVTALSLAKKSATVIMLCRRSERADQALANVAAAAAGCAPTLVHCNLLDFDSVRAAACSISSLVLHSGLDALCLNAGIMMQPDEASKDGYDITMSTNVLSHFLLTRELMPALEQAASSRGDARVVSMSSGSGFGPPAFDARFLARQGGNLGGGARAMSDTIRVSSRTSSSPQRSMTSSLPEPAASRHSRARRVCVRQVLVLRYI